MRLELKDPRHVERLASFLSGLGLTAIVAGPTTVEVVPPHEHDETAALAELATYLKVWDALYPDIEVDAKAE